MLSSKIHSTITFPTQTPFKPVQTESAFEGQPFAMQRSEVTLLHRDTSSQATAAGLSHSFNVINVHRSDPSVIQPKLTLGPVGDKYEQEADWVAQQVIHDLNRSSSEPGTGKAEPTAVQINPVAQQLATGEGGTGVALGVEAAIAQARSGGQSLPEQVREPMERTFGADFSWVRVHTNSWADELNRFIQARAFTTGQDIFVRQGEYQPGSTSGQHLLAHELTHVVQQDQADSKGAATIQRMRFYQGTKRKNLSNISEYGLDPSFGGRGGASRTEAHKRESQNRIHLTPFKTMARDYAKRGASAALIELHKEDWKLAEHGGDRPEDVFAKDYLSSIQAHAYGVMLIIDIPDEKLPDFEFEKDPDTTGKGIRTGKLIPPEYIYVRHDNEITPIKKYVEQAASGKTYESDAEDSEDERRSQFHRNLPKGKRISEREEENNRVKRRRR